MHRQAKAEEAAREAERRAAEAEAERLAAEARAEEERLQAEKAERERQERQEPRTLHLLETWHFASNVDARRLRRERSHPRCILASLSSAGCILQFYFASRWGLPGMPRGSAYYKCGSRTVAECKQMTLYALWEGILGYLT